MLFCWGMCELEVAKFVLFDLDMLMLQHTYVMWPRKAVENELDDPPKIRHDVNHALGSGAMLVGLTLLDAYLLPCHGLGRVNQQTHLLLIEVIAWVVLYVKLGSFRQLVD